MKLEDLLAKHPDPPSRPRESENFQTRIAAAAQWATEQAEGDLLEIGACRGQTTVVLAQIAVACGRRVLVVDPWKPGTQDCRGHEYGEFLRRTKPFDNIDVVRLDSRSEEAKKCIGKRKLCFALVDGLHTYEAVKSDIEACFHALLIAVDDTNWNDGIRRAYEEARGHKVRHVGRESYLLPGEGMELKLLTLGEIVNRLRANDPFAIVRYGDGEWLAVLDKTPPAKWGVNEHEPDLPGLGEALRKALRNHPTEDVYLGMVAVEVTERMGLMPEVEKWLAENAPQLEWHAGDVFRRAIEAGELRSFIKMLRELDTVLVGGPHLKRVAGWLGARFVEIPAHNCWEAHDETLEALKGMSCDAMVFSAAMMSEVLIPELWDGTTTLIDVGALWDPFVGKETRSWHLQTRRNMRNMMKSLGRPDSRSIIVLALPTSGGSAIAGALHRLGVDMGEGHLQPPDSSSPHGYYEDRRWSKAHMAVVGPHYSTKEPDALLDRHRKIYAQWAQACAAKPVWGMKSPRLCFVLHLILPMLQANGCAVRIVHVQRDWEANVASLKRHSEIAYRGRKRMTDEEAEAKLLEWQAALERRLEEFDGPVLEVDYDELVDDPIPALQDLEAFCFKGIAELSAGIEGAAAWINPSLRHEYAEPAATVAATDAAIELALGANVDVTTIAGTGQDGRVLIGDVRQYLEDYEDTDADAEPPAGSGDDAEGSGNGGNPERRG